MSTAALPQLMTPMEVGLWLSLPTRQVERLARQAVIPSITLPDGSLVFDRADLVEWITRLKAAGRGVTDAS
jgi:hypothetical protein